MARIDLKQYTVQIQYFLAVIIKMIGSFTYYYITMLKYIFPGHTKKNQGILSLEKLNQF